MTKFLAFSRALIEFAVTFHLFVLNVVAFFQDRKIAKTAKASATAELVVAAAASRLSNARAARSAAVIAERAAFKSRMNLDVAITAEARHYRR